MIAPPGGGGRAPKQCNDGADNDGDTFTDYPSDPGCSSKTDNNELGTVACDNGVDDDTDTFTDYPDDPGCASVTDSSELGGTCDNDVDDDTDTFVDYPNDPGCASLNDTSELNANVKCDDGTDNDADTFVDYPDDPECNSPSENSEINCSDTDGGVNIFTQGTASGTYGGNPFSNTDFCVSGTLLTEYYCTSLGQADSFNQSCVTNTTTSCVSGACV